MNEKSLVLLMLYGAIDSAWGFGESEDLKHWIQVLRSLIVAIKLKKYQEARRRLDEMERLDK